MTAQTPPAAPAATDAPDPLIGRTINDRFRVVAEIARGGMGRVYRAEQLPLGRLCALKVLAPDATTEKNAEFHKRFFLEASVAAKLRHPNAVTIYDYGQTHDDVYFIAMEYLEGRTLHRAITEEAPFDARRALKIARQIGRALREAHRLGVTHRDLKPANVFLVQEDDDPDFAKVLDFGLVKTVEAADEVLTQTGLFMGSPKYMAPEQIRGETVGPFTDVYAMGAVLYAMLTRRVPFDRATALDTLAAHLSEPVPAMRIRAPDAVVHEAIERVVLRCLAKPVAERYGTMDELLVALGQAEAEAFGERLSRVSGEWSLPGGVLPSDAVTTATPSVVTETLVESAGAVLPSRTPAAIERDASPPARGRTWAVALAGALAVAAVAVIATLALSGPHGAAASHGEAQPAVAHVSLESDPAGAEVYEGAALLGRTPLRLAWTGAQADPSRAHTFTFRMAQRREASVTLAGSSMSYSARLDPLPAATTATTTTIATTTTAPDAGGPRVHGARGAAARPRTPGRTSAPPGYRWVDDW